MLHRRVACRVEERSNVWYKCVRIFRMKSVLKQGRLTTFTRTGNRPLAFQHFLQRLKQVVEILC